MHTKINRGISPNQPPHTKSKINNENENKLASHHTTNLGKNKIKDPNESSRRSSSLKVK